MHGATGRRREAKGGDGSGRHVSEEGRQVKGSAAPLAARPVPGLQTPYPALEGGLGGLQPVPAAHPQSGPPTRSGASTAGNPGARSSRS